jgi:perosamine synthetase
LEPRSRIPLARPSLGDGELAEVEEVLRSGQVSRGVKVAEFEQLVADSVGSRYAFATTSCTTALHLALVALGVGPGDEVLVPDFTFPATANVVAQQGAVPVLVDIDLSTYNVNPGQLSRHLTARTRAVMPVHLFGLSADMGPVMDFAAEHGLAVVEDAACALGATYRGRACGSFSDAGCFSFHARKILTTGEGGMIVTDRDDVAEKIVVLRSHGGIRENNRFQFQAAGFNYRLSDIQAAVGVAQMHRLPELLARREELANVLRERLSSVDGVGAPPDSPDGRHTYQAFVVLLADGIDREKVIAAMAASGVETTLGTYALHREPFFQKTYGYVPGQLPSSEAAFRRTLALPLFPGMGEDDLDRVIEALAAAIHAATGVASSSVSSA